MFSIFHFCNRGQLVQTKNTRKLGFLTWQFCNVEGQVWVLHRKIQTLRTRRAIGSRRWTGVQVRGRRGGERVFEECDSNARRNGRDEVNGRELSECDG